MPTRTLHFSFGPVQGFVAQARRTRDSWAGSYLLSYLSGRAMRALEEACGDPAGARTILFPSVVNDPLMRVIRGTATHEDRALVAATGLLPNRFKAAVPESVTGEVAAGALREAWKTIADKVLDLIGRPSGSERIWWEQIATTWDCAWVIGEDGDLDRRKNLRAFAGRAEGGEKCTVCGERQEISGRASGARAPIDQWWRDHVVGRLRYRFDLRERERLCAVCLTKRLFPRISEEAIGWNVPENFPSTAFMAALGWIRAVADAYERSKAVEAALRDFVTAARDVSRSERDAQIPVVEEVSARLPADARPFAELDATAFFEEGIRNPREFEPDLAPGAREDLVRALKRLQGAVAQHRGASGRASPFYAILLMDGDGMGALLGEHAARQREISRALARFTRKVTEIVPRQHGRLIYAGGDDVFALLPLDTAIDCAVECREAYGGAFQAEAPFVLPEAGTISAAIVYAHMHTPLGVAVRDAHRLLEEVAKSGAGRDAIACRVWKRGGPILTWALPWKKACEVEDGESSTIVGEVQRCLDGVGDKGRDPRAAPPGGVSRGRQFSSRFLYRLSDLFEVVGDDDSLATALLAAEYLGTREIRWPDDWDAQRKRQEAEKRVNRLLALCRGWRRRMDAGTVSYERGRLQADGALLVRFLVQKEV